MTKAELAANPIVGRYSGIIVAAVLVSKLVGGVTAVLLALILGNRLSPENSIRVEEE